MPILSMSLPCPEALTHSIMLPEALRHSHTDMKLVLSTFSVSKHFTSTRFMGSMKVVRNSLKSLWHNLLQVEIYKVLISVFKKHTLKKN